MLYGSAVLRAQSQDVAEAARQERARKQAQQKKNKHVYTNEDLSRAKILTPEDQGELDAKKQECAQKKNCAPAANSQDALDANSEKPGTSLGEIARELRKQKERQKELEALKPKQSAPFHLPSWDEVFASRILPADAEVAASRSVAPRPEVARPKIDVSAEVAARPKVPAHRELRQPVAPALGAGTGSHVVRRDPFAPPAARPKVRPEISAEVSPRLRDEVRSDAKPALPDVFAGSKAAGAPSTASSFAGSAKPARPRDFSAARPNAPEKVVAPEPEKAAPTLGEPAQPKDFAAGKPAAPARPRDFAVAGPNAPATHSHAAQPAAPALAAPVAPGAFGVQPQTVPVRPKSFASVKPNPPQRDFRSNQAAAPALANPVTPATAIEAEKPNVVAPMEPVAPTTVLPAAPSAVEPTRPRNFDAVKPNAPVGIRTEQTGEPPLARPAAPATILAEQPKVNAPEMPAATTTIAPAEPAAAAPSVLAAPAIEYQPSEAPIERSKPEEVAPVEPRRAVPVVPSAPEAVVPTPSSVGLRIVSVKAGDSLWKVAEENLGSGSRWPEVAAANPWIANPNQIQVGAQLALPAAATKTESGASRGSNTIQVKRGDTLWSLAKSHLRSFSKWPCLAAANPGLTDPNTIREGQELQLPANCHDSNGGSLRPDEK